VRVPAEGRAMLLDLGAALEHDRGPRTASLVTKSFAAPEVLAGGTVTPAADLYGLGALAWAAATGEAPKKTRGALRDRAPWMAPSLAGVIEALLEAHPMDRPKDARAVLALLGNDAALGAWEARRGAPTYREAELAALLEHARGVLYVVGPAGAGKSHLAQEL